MGDDDDPKALIREAYNIEGVSFKECRSIFLDWALSIPLGKDTNEILNNLLKQYSTAYPSHPMTKTIKEAFEDRPKRKRNGRRRSAGQ